MEFAELQRKVHVAKDRRNDFGGYNYRTAEGILSAIKAALPDDATVTVTDELQELAGQIFVSATAKISFASGEEYSATGHALHPLTKKGMDPSQITGSASSYARKYALSGLVALDDGSVDPDATNKGDEPERPEYTDAQKRDTLKGLLEKQTTKQLVNATWANPKFDAAYKGLPEPMQLELQAVKNARMEAVPDDPAMQAPAA
ncbi:ERF family protein [Dinoroseobacter sp. S375]|uniref:ERF family protein n=1 Tax=Dinoroseobacter sp. S375 TaxID=3415136 RepID=UPI003C7B8077